MELECEGLQTCEVFLIFINKNMGGMKNIENKKILEDTKKTA